MKKMRSPKTYLTVAVVLLMAFSTRIAAAARKRKPKKSRGKWKMNMDGAKDLKITDTPVNMVIEKGVNKKPDSKGFVLKQTLQLPEFKNGMIYRPYSGGGFAAAGNRVEGVAFSSLDNLSSYKPTETNKDHRNVSQEIQFVLLQISDDNYLALMPMVTPKTISYIYLVDKKFVLATGNFGTETVKGDIHVLAWAYGKSPYQATYLAWKEIMDSGQIAADWRNNKTFPEMYQYLGWCSWEHYKTNISEKILKNAFTTIESCGAPVRWFIVDDGYLTHEGRRIITFEPDKKKFPNGWKAITSLTKPDGIKWIGVWRMFLGYMNGISPKHKMNDIKQHLTPNKSKKMLVPKESKASADAFFEKMTLDAKNSGFDFTKVDFQRKSFGFYWGMNNAVQASRYNNEALEDACKKYNIPLLNCIAQPHVNAYQTKYSAITRTSPDYNHKDKNKNRCNTYQSFANHLWMSKSVWGDLDMFHSHSSDARVMALARAISGGPVYISDEPSKIVPDVLKKFCAEDGKLFRTKAPAVLLPEGFFIHPFTEKKAARVIAPLEGNVAALGLFNLLPEGAGNVTTTISAADYPYAGEQLLPYSGPWAQPKDGLLVYDPAAIKAEPLTGTKSYNLANYSGKLLQLHPMTNGWAAIGRIDKYLPAAAVEKVSSTPDKLTFNLLESGPFAVWSKSGAPKMDGVTFKAKGNGLYVADLKVGEKSKVCIVTR